LLGISITATSGVSFPMDPSPIFFSIENKVFLGTLLPHPLRPAKLVNINSEDRLYYSG